MIEQSFQRNSSEGSRIGPSIADPVEVKQAILRSRAVAKADQSMQGMYCRLVVALFCAIAFLVPVSAWAIEALVAFPVFELGIATVFCLFILSLLFPRIRIPAFSSLDILVFVLLGLIIASALTGGSWASASTIVQMLLMFFVIRHSNLTRGQVKGLLFALLITGGLLACWSIHKPLNVNRNLLSGYLSLLLPMSLFLWKDPSPYHKTLGVVLTTLLAYAVTLTLTRAGFIACFAGMLVFGLIKDRRFVILPFVYLLLCGLLVEDARNRFAPLRRVPIIAQPDPTGGDASITSRLHVWEFAWHQFNRAPLLGIGIGNYMVELGRHRQHNPADRRFRETVDAHNSFLNILCELGIVGFTLFLAVIGGAIWAASQKILEGGFKNADSIEAAVLSGILAVLLRNLTNSLLLKAAPVVLGFWIVLALLSGFSGRSFSSPRR